MDFIITISIACVAGPVQNAGYRRGRVRHQGRGQGVLGQIFRSGRDHFSVTN